MQVAYQGRVVLDPFQVAFRVSFPSFLDPFHVTAFHRTCAACMQRGVDALGVLGVTGGVEGGGTGDVEGTLDVMVTSYQEAVVVDTWADPQRILGDTSQQEVGVAWRRGLEGTQDKEEGGEGRDLQGWRRVACVVVAASAGAYTAASCVGTCEGAGEARAAACDVGGACVETPPPDAALEMESALAQSP